MVTALNPDVVILETLGGIGKNPKFLKSIRSRDPLAPLPFHLRCNDENVGYFMLSTLMERLGSNRPDSETFRNFLIRRGRHYTEIDADAPAARPLLTELEYRGFHRHGTDVVVRVVGRTEINFLVKTLLVAVCFPCRKVGMMMPHGGLVRSPDDTDLESAFTLRPFLNVDDSPLGLPEDYESEGTHQAGESDSSSDIEETDGSAVSGKRHTDHTEASVKAGKEERGGVCRGGC